MTLYSWIGWLVTHVFVEDRTSIWKTIMIIVATTFIIETYRCTELQQIPGSELDDHDDDDGAHDAIWLPVSDG